MFSKKPWSHGDQKDEHKEQSLTSILATPELQAELTMLIANCTETMRKSITDVFSATQTEQQTPQSQVTEGSTAANDNLANTSNAIRNLSLGQEEDKDDQEEAAEKAKKELEWREKEIAAPEMQELKKAALAFFDDWRENVLRRVGETINARKEQTEEQKEEAKPTSSKPPEKEITDTKGKDESIDVALKELYPPTKTTLTELPVEKRALVLHSLLLIILGLEHYSAHSRALLLHLTTSLKLSVSLLAEDESSVARGLLEVAEQHINADAETKKRAEENATSRKWKVGLASVAGAAVIGLTGGLAAPLLAAGIGTMMGGLGLASTTAAAYLGTLASSSVIVGGLFGAYGAKMSGKVMDEYAKEVSDFAFLPVRHTHNPLKLEKEHRKLRVSIGVGGWVTEKEEVVRAWRIIGASVEGYALRWELESLMTLGNSIAAIVKSAAWGYAKSEIIKRTVFASLKAGLWPLSLLRVSKVVDNPFSIAMARSEKAGEVLADALINKVQGERPVTLIGYSVGARVIYTCLRSLAERKAFGLIESVVLLGAPCPSTSAEWREMRSVVSGRLVNVYSTDDYILAFLYRTNNIQLGVAGLQAVKGVKGVQNIDVSEVVNGHTRYRFLTGSILRQIGFEDIDAEEVAIEEAEMHDSEQQEEKQREAKKKEAKDEDTEAKDLEKEVEKKNKEGMMGWATEKLKDPFHWAKAEEEKKGEAGKCGDLKK